MLSKLSRSAQSRINGAKSKGPISPEGKARSSQNALKHGFAAVINVVLRIEDEPAFHQHVDGFRASFKPQDYTESTLVDQLAAINWRQARLIGLETALIDAQVELQLGSLRATQPDACDDPYFRLVQAWQALAQKPKNERPSEMENEDPTLATPAYDINSLELLRRYQTSLDRQFRNAMLNLRQYRQDFGTGTATTTAAAAPTPAPPARQTEQQSIEEPNEPKPPIVSRPKIRPEPTPISIVRPASPEIPPDNES
ncbi:MAG TPA: hypothetical protein VGL53_23945 [Bryobacteraceae bacterium]|jgi:hypothetical protein